MEIVDRRPRTLLFHSSLTGWPYPLKKCDHLGCEALASHHCSAHGVHFCRRHFEEHREDWHCSTWEEPLGIARC